MKKCSSLLESAYLERHNQLAKVIRRGIAIKYTLLDKNSPPCDRYKPEPVLESAKTILCCNRCIITDEKVDFNRSDTVLVDRENKIALLIEIADPLTHNLPETEKKIIRKYGNLALEIKNILKFNNVTV